MTRPSNQVRYTTFWHGTFGTPDILARLAVEGCRLNVVPYTMPEGMEDRGFHISWDIGTERKSACARLTLFPAICSK